MSDHPIQPPIQQPEIQQQQQHLQQPSQTQQIPQEQIQQQQLAQQRQAEIERQQQIQKQQKLLERQQQKKQKDSNLKLQREREQFVSLQRKQILRQQQQFDAASRAAEPRRLLQPHDLLFASMPDPLISTGRTRSKHSFTSDIEEMMYGFGDDWPCDPEAVSVLERLVVDYIRDLGTRAMQVAELRPGGKLDKECFMFLVRKDKRKFQRVMKLLTVNAELKNVQKLDIKEDDSDFPC